MVGATGEDLVDLAVVATATVDRVNLYDEPQGLVVGDLANPIPSGGPLLFLLDNWTFDGWYEVLLPLRPNGSTGWINEADVAISSHNYRIQVELGAFLLTVLNRGKLIESVPIGVARDNTPTPEGRYYTTELIQPPTPSSIYGSFAYGLSGYSEVLTEFNGGPGQLGIHGTNDDDSIGEQVSSGCLRMRNADIERLVGFLPLGVPVTIVA